jgi:transcriptional regulator with XRE-family HTH domain
MTGAEFRELRLRTRLSLRGLARIWRVHYMTLWRYEKDRRSIPPQLATLLMIMGLHARPCRYCGGRGVERYERD